jgi:hypothetical protein
MCYSNKVEDFYPNKFIIGNNEYDRKTCVTKDRVKKHDEESLDSDDLNVPYNYNETYDLHYFLTSLLDLFVSQELFDWVVDIYPDELIPREDSSSTDSSRDSSDSHSSESSVESVSSGEFSQDVLKRKMDKIKLSDVSVPKETSESSDSTSDSTDSTDSTDSISDSQSSIDTSDSSSSEYNRYLSEGRMKNGIESQFEDLPTPTKILKHSFFDSFKNKPDDFDESKALYFNAGF